MTGELANDRFAAHTRSASFALTMSHPQIQQVLALDKVMELRRKYPWYEPHHANFGTADQLAVEWSNGTIRSLARRGLVDVVPTEPPCCRTDVIRLTRAGQLLVAMLGEAGFELEPHMVPAVPRHSDDRAKLWFEGMQIHTAPSDGDRRDPDDAPWLSHPVGAFGSSS